MDSTRLTRRQAFKAGAAATFAGYAVAAEKAEAQAIQTDTAGIETGDQTVKIGDYSMPVYEARPGVCRKYPESSRCGYYEFLKFERSQQDDPEFNALT